MPVTSPDYHLCFRYTGYRSEVPTTPFLGSINLLERLTELRETLTYIYQFIKGHDTDEQPDEAMYKVRSGRVPSAGASVPVELGCIPLPVWVCPPTQKLSEPPTTGILWRLPRVGMNNY